MIASAVPSCSATSSPSSSWRSGSATPSIKLDQSAEAHVGKVADSSHDRLLRSGLVGERVVFMGDDPAVAIPPQSHCQPEPVTGVALQLLRRAAVQ
jgi:hypothetical protein